MTDDPRSALDHAREAFRAELVGAGLLVPTAVEGLYGRSAVFEDVVEGVDRLVRAAGADEHAERLRFPPVIPRSVFERTDYLASFPNLTGSVHTFTGDDRAHAALLAVHEAGGDWAALLEPAEVMLTPAACHPVYPTLSGTVPEQGRRIDVAGYCFRHEPAVDPMRLQAFRMHEYVYVGTPHGAREHRSRWVGRGLEVLAELGLPAREAVAHDPFFGRAGRLLAANQREEELKIELVVTIYDEDPAGAAVVSCNCHLDHFGAPFGISTPDGEVAHSACVGFGLERIALAMLRHHGLDVRAWPQAVRGRLWP